MCKEICYTFRGMELNKVYHLLEALGAGGEGDDRGWDGWMESLTRESEWTLGVGDGQGGLACCDSWGHQESDTTEQLNWTELISSFAFTQLRWRPGWIRGLSSTIGLDCWYFQRWISEVHAFNFPLPKC